MLEVSGAKELSAMTREFRALRGRWRLTPAEEAVLLGDAGERIAEEARRRLLEFDKAMRAMFGEEGLLEWLREAGPTGISPLAFLMTGRDQQRACLAAARQRHLEVLGYEA